MTATQVEHPWKATLRTIVQVGIPAFITLLGVLPLIVSAVLEGFGETLPPEFVAWMVAASAGVTALAGVIARIMAIPAVNAALAHVGLGAAPKGE